MNIFSKDIQSNKNVSRGTETRKQLLMFIYLFLSHGKWNYLFRKHSREDSLSKSKRLFVHLIERAKETKSSKD